MHDDRKRDPMPPPDATPEEIGEFWDTHSLADYWDETHEVKFQVNLKSDQNQTLSDEKKSDLHTTIPDEASPALGVVTDLVSESILPAPIRRNALKAFDRLCSALIDLPVGALERRAAEKRAESEARIKIRDEITTQITQQIKVDPEYALRAGHKYAEKIIREQLNLDNISAIAAKELKKTESDSSTNQDFSQPNTVSTDRTANDSEEKTLDDVWLNIFETEARPQSTEEGQLLFGRILAGEIRNPGSYSILTLKTFGELDQDVAALFKRLCSLCVVVENPCDGVIVDARVVSVAGDATQNALKRYGLGFDQLNILNEYRLVISDYHSWHDYTVSRGNENNWQTLLFQHQGKYWNLLPLPDQVETQEFRLLGVELSRVSRELFHIVDQEPDKEYTRDLQDYLKRQHVQMTEIPVR